MISIYISINSNGNIVLFLLHNILIFTFFLISVSNANVRPKWNELPVSKQCSLGILESDNEIRQFCGQLVSHEWFEYGVIALIMISCVLLAVDEPAALPETKQVISQLDFCLTIIFVDSVSAKFSKYPLITLL